MTTKLSTYPMKSIFSNSKELCLLAHSRTYQATLSHEE